MYIFKIDGIGDVEIKKSARAKRLILSVQPNGFVKATIPKSIPYIVAKQYVLRNKLWLTEQLEDNPSIKLFNGKKIGRKHLLKFQYGQKLSSRVGNSEIIVKVPTDMKIRDVKVQAEAIKASTRAVRRQAEVYLPKRLYALAQLHQYKFSEVRCKALKTRWGSCSSDNIINLNIWLMQLPDDLIDYVLMHELTHLHHRHHQKGFWQELEQHLPDYKNRRKLLKQYRPYLSN